MALFDLAQIVAILDFTHIAMSKVIYCHTTMSGMPENLSPPCAMLFAHSQPSCIFPLLPQDYNIQNKMYSDESVKKTYGRHKNQESASILSKKFFLLLDS